MVEKEYVWLVEAIPAPLPGEASCPIAEAVCTSEEEAVEVIEGIVSHREDTFSARKIPTNQYSPYHEGVVFLDEYGWTQQGPEEHAPTEDEVEATREYNLRRREAKQQARWDREEHEMDLRTGLTQPETAADFAYLSTRPLDEKVQGSDIARRGVRDAHGYRRGNPGTVYLLLVTVEGEHEVGGIFSSQEDAEAAGERRADEYVVEGFELGEDTEEGMEW